MPATGNAFAYDVGMRIRDGSLPLPRSHRMLKKSAGGVLARYCRPHGDTACPLRIEFRASSATSPPAAVLLTLSF